MPFYTYSQFIGLVLVAIEVHLIKMQHRVQSKAIFPFHTLIVIRIKISNRRYTVVQRRLGYQICIPVELHTSPTQAYLNGTCFCNALRLFLLLFLLYSRG